VKSHRLAAEARIRFMVCADPIAAEHLRRVDGLWVAGGWTDFGVRTMRWPRHFTKAERKLIRKVAQLALESGKK